jgi:hypothetical protein
MLVQQERLVLLARRVQLGLRVRRVRLAQQAFKVYLLLDEFITSKVQQAIFLLTKN